MERNSPTWRCRSVSSATRVPCSAERQVYCCLRCEKEWISPTRRTRRLWPLRCIAAPANREVDDIGGCSLIELSERGGDQAFEFDVLGLQLSELAIIDDAFLFDQAHAELGDGVEQLLAEVIEVAGHPPLPTGPVVFQLS